MPPKGTKKLQSVPENSELTIKPEPKKRASRAKKQPTREEALEMLKNASIELEKIIQDLKSEETKIQSVVQSLSLKRIPELITTTLSNLAEDKQEMDDNYENLKSQPETTTSN